MRTAAPFYLFGKQILKILHKERSIKMSDEKTKQEHSYSIRICSFGDLVVAKRREKEISLEKAAELCNMSARALANIERNSADPHLSTVVNIAHGLSIEIGELDM